MRTITLEHARRAAQGLESGYAQSFRVLPKEGPEFVVAEADGTMICTVEEGCPRKGSHPRQWREMRLVAARAQGRVEAKYAASLEIKASEPGARLRKKKP